MARSLITEPRKLYVCMSERFVPAHQKVKQFVDSGQYGPPSLITAYAVSDSGVPGGGPQAGAHIVDLVLWWLGRPKTVSCWSGRFVSESLNGVEDTVVILNYGHILANIAISCAGRADPWMEVAFCDASFRLTQNDATPLTRLTDKQAPVVVPVKQAASWRQDSVATCVSHFLDCLVGKAQPEFGTDAARETLEIISLAHQSLRGSRTVTLP